MCLIAFAWRTHPDYALILVANRDEFFDRPAQPAHWWPQRHLLAGRDEQAGGTWLGIGAGGRFAALTNFRQGGQRRTAPGTPSRGALVTGYLDGTPESDFADHLSAEGARYAGFNLLYGDLGGGPAAGELHYFSNRAAPRSPLPPGVHALSNAALGDAWPKVDFATGALSALIERGAPSMQALLAVLDHRRPADDARLPDTGIGIERERLLSAPFIVSPVYGTRCTTALRVARDGRVDFAERSFDRSGTATGERRFRWRLGSATPWREAPAGATA